MMFSIKSMLSYNSQYQESSSGEAMTGTMPCGREPRKTCVRVPTHILHHLHLSLSRSLSPARFVLLASPNSHTPSSSSSSSSSSSLSLSLSRQLALCSLPPIVDSTSRRLHAMQCGCGAGVGRVWGRVWGLSEILFPIFVGKSHSCNHVHACIYADCGRRASTTMNVRYIAQENDI